MENVGAIPFLDYKHFASRIFFPEVKLTYKEMLTSDIIIVVIISKITLLHFFP